MTTHPAPILGILAGMGPRSTGPFVDLVVTECQRQYGARHDIDFPKMLICSQPAPFYEDRPPDHAALEAATREGLLHLERAGASFLAIACNTVHIYYDRLATAVNVPLLDMVALAVAAIPTSARRVALIAARPTVEADLYQKLLRQRAIDVVPLDWQTEVDQFLAATRTSTDPAEHARRWARLLTQAQAAAADTVLVACLDLSAVLAHAHTPLRLVDAAQCLAREIVSRYVVLRSEAAPGAAAAAAAAVARRGDYTLSTDPSRLDIEAIHAYLTRSYWAGGIPQRVVAAAIQGSLCFGMYDREARQVGFARVVTDRATYAYLCDVYVLEEHRGHGLGKWLVESVMQHPALAGLRRFSLATRDAHSLYAQFGFTPLRAPDRFMEIARPDIYKTMQ